MRILNSYVV